MAKSTFSGPVVSINGFQVGSAGTPILKQLKGASSITTSALAAGAEEDLTFAVTGAAAGDVVVVTMANAAMETGMSIGHAWVSAADTVKVRVSNLGASSLTAQAKALSYLVIGS